MGTRPSTYVHGTALEISWADDSRSLTELIYSVVSRAVEESSAVPFEDIDSVVLAAHDLVDGRSLSSMVTAPAAGAYLRDEIRYGDDGAAALAAAVIRLEAGHGQHCIVASWGRTSEHQPDQVSRALFDPFYTRPLGLRELDVSAMRANAWMGIDPQRAAGRAKAAASRIDRVRSNPRALQSGGEIPVSPGGFSPDEMPVQADVVSAMVLSLTESGTRIAGLGQASEPYQPGSRDLVGMTSLTRATQRAFDDTSWSIGDVDLVEIDGFTIFDEAIGLEAIGRVKPGQGLDALASDARLNASGGSRAGYCAPAMGLTRVIEGVLQLRGEAGGIQAGQPRTALATGTSLVAGQTNTAIVLEEA